MRLFLRVKPEVRMLYKNGRNTKLQQALLLALLAGLAQTSALCDSTSQDSHPSGSSSQTQKARALPADSTQGKKSRGTSH
ncbi:MAG: hypothetical protein ACRD3W_09665, partial [Terriglobales bacterium]